MHACALARELGLGTVLVPFLPGAFSAYGILISPFRVEYGRSLVRPLERAGPRIRSALEGFQDRAVRDLEAQGRDARDAVFEASVDLRFRGQSYEINVPMRGDPASAFRREHRRRFGYASKTEPIEVVTVRLVATIPQSRRVPKPPVTHRKPPLRREVLFDDGWQTVAVFPRETLGIGRSFEGPAVIEEAQATTLVPPEARVRVEASGILAIEVTR
jgi:N-methylhydantoinase A